MTGFALHPQLAADTAVVAQWSVSRVLLMDDARYPWLILVPRQANLRELHDLSEADGLVLMSEIRRAGSGLKRLFAADKINTAALGNMVPQLHIHVIARQSGDAAWPRPVWGTGEMQRYGAADRAEMIQRLVTGL